MYNVCIPITIQLPYHYLIEDQHVVPKLSPFASWPGTIINTQWLKLPMSRTNFHGP